MIACRQLRKGYAEDFLSQTMIDRILSECTKKYITLSLRYVNTKLNYADFPSRTYLRKRLCNKIFSDARDNPNCSIQSSINYFAAAKPRGKYVEKDDIHSGLISVKRCAHIVYDKATSLCREPEFFDDNLFITHIAKAVLVRHMLGLPKFNNSSYLYICKRLVEQKILLPEYYIQESFTGIKSVFNSAEYLLHATCSVWKRKFPIRIVIWSEN